MYHLRGKSTEENLLTFWVIPSLKSATARLAAQYDTYKPFPDLAVNGRQTLNENIADLAGTSAAYDAYRTCLAGKAAPVQNGFTGDQQFFLGFATAVGIKDE